MQLGRKSAAVTDAPLCEHVSRSAGTLHFKIWHDDDTPWLARTMKGKVCQTVCMLAELAIPEGTTYPAGRDVSCRQHAPGPSCLAASLAKLQHGSGMSLTGWDLTSYAANTQARQQHAAALSVSGSRNSPPPLLSRPVHLQITCPAGDVSAACPFEGESSIEAGGACAGLL